MKGRTQQYQDLISFVDIQTTAEDEKLVKRYIVTANVIRIVTICVLVVSIFPVFIDEYAICIAGLLFFLFYLAYRQYHSKKFRAPTLQGCDPMRTVALHRVLASYARDGKGWLLHFYNLSINLYYAGRFEDAKKVQELLIKYFSDPLGQLYYELLETEFSVYKKDIAAIEVHCNNMMNIEPLARPRGTIRFLYMERIHYLALIRMCQDGAYTELYQEISNLMSLHRSMLAEVKKNYWLYHVALLLGDVEKAEEHRQFVLQNGGTLWYRKAVCGNKETE